MDGALGAADPVKKQRNTVLIARNYSTLCRESIIKRDEIIKKPEAGGSSSKLSIVNSATL